MLLNIVMQLGARVVLTGGRGEGMLLASWYVDDLE